MCESCLKQIRSRKHDLLVISTLTVFLVWSVTRSWALGVGFIPGMYSAYGVVFYSLLFYLSHGIFSRFYTQLPPQFEQTGIGSICDSCRISVELCGELNWIGICSECSKSITQMWLDFKDLCNLYIKVNHIQERVYIISGLITILITAIVGYCLFEFTRYDLFWMNVSVSAHKNLNFLITCGLAYLIFSAYVRAIKAIQTLLLMSFADTTSDENNALMEQDVSVLKTTYIGELSHHDKAFFLNTFQKEFKISPVKEFFERIREFPLETYWMRFVINSIFVFGIIDIIVIDINIGLVSYVFAAITLLVLPLFGLIGHLLISFLVVKIKVQQQYADELTSQFEHLLSQENSSVD
jgi:hypothetical protein